MKTYNSPKTQIINCKAAYMLMTGNVSGGDIKGVKSESTPLDEHIDIN